MDEWTSIEDLLIEAGKVHKDIFTWHGKQIAVHWQEITVSESPSLAGFIGVMSDPSEMSKDDLIRVGEKISDEMAFAMIQKGQKTAEVSLWSRDTWTQLPATLKRQIVSTITGERNETGNRFLDGPKTPLSPLVS
jgi:hypothetical protein